VRPQKVLKHCVDGNGTHFVPVSCKHGEIGVTGRSDETLVNGDVVIRAPRFLPVGSSYFRTGVTARN
jgi:hypothetical protein